MYNRNMEMIQEERKVSPKDVFMHLLAIVTLYASAISFLVLLFQYIDLGFPDVLAGGYYNVQGAYSAIRMAIATLVVVFPVHILTMRALQKSYEANPSKRELRIRKWLIYFTLFITALVVIGDLVTLINSFLGGEITMRFLLKALSVFFVAGSIFAYDFYDVKKHGTE